MLYNIHPAHKQIKMNNIRHIPAVLLTFHMFSLLPTQRLEKDLKAW